MKEVVGYNPKTDKIWLAMKDDRDFTNGKWIQNWFIIDGERCLRPKGNHKAAKVLKDLVVLESGSYLDEYRGY